MKNALNSLQRKLNTGEERISEYEDSSIDISQTACVISKLTHSSTCIIGIPEEKETNIQKYLKNNDQEFSKLKDKAYSQEV